MNEKREALRIPQDDHRAVIIGRTGSGKTVFGTHCLSWRSYDQMPWIVFNYKRDRLLNQLPATELGVNDPIPTEAGLYMVRAAPQEGSIDAMLERAHARGNVGLFVDEGYMVGNRSFALNKVFTQGRSLRVPVIFLTQRPNWISRFVLSEAEFFHVFPLVDVEDKKQIKRFLPVEINYSETLDRYESLYFDVGTNRLAKFRPAPSEQEILDVFDRRKPRKVKRYGGATRI